MLRHGAVVAWLACFACGRPGAMGESASDAAASMDGASAVDAGPIESGADATTPDAAEAAADDSGADASREVPSGGICSDSWCWDSPLPQGNTLTGVWAAALDDLWTVTEDGAALHWDGASWSAQRWPKASLGVVWGTGPQDVWVAGSIFAHWDGNAWTTVPSPVPYVASIAGTGPSDVWAIGYQGSIAHFDGASWSTMPSGTYESLGAVWAADPSDAWVVGTCGTLLHFDGQAWTPAPGAPFAGWDLRHVWGSGPRDVWMNGQQDVNCTPEGDAALPRSYPSSLFHYDGTAWIPVTGAPVYAGGAAIAGSGPNDVWFFGNEVDHFDGSTWSSTPNFYLAGGVALSPTEAWGIGNYGAVYAYDGRRWSSLNQELTPGLGCLDLTSVWASSTSDVWAVGGFGDIFHGDGRGWSSVTNDCAGGTMDLFAQVHGSGADDVWIAGRDDSWHGVVEHFDGTRWSPVPVPATTYALSGVLAWSASDVWAVGPQDRLHWDGRQWTPFALGGVPVPATGSPTDGMVWGSAPDDVWVAGKSGTAAHWNGVNWTAVTVTTDFPYDFSAVWGTSATDVWLSGTSGRDAMGVVMHWDGRAWSPLVKHFSGSSEGVWGAGPADVWLDRCEFSGPCYLAHWDGAAWTPMFSHSEFGSISLYGIATTGEAWAVNQSIILHHPAAHP